MGSKARLSKDIAPIINKLISEKNISIYIEPFVGGANMIRYITADTKIGSDSNECLISMWKSLQNGWKPPEHISKDLYKSIKNNKEIYPKELVAIAGFCSTYNAKWFGGYAGIVNTKIGTVRNYYDESIRNIQKQLKDLLDVSFQHCDYTRYSNVRNALLYCDIPYDGTTQYGNNEEFDYEKFWNWVRGISKNNIVLVSEYNAPKDFNCIFQKALITNLDKNSRKTDIEKLFIYSESYVNFMF